MTVPHFQWFLTIQKLSFCMSFSWIVHVFSEPLPESIFRGSWCRSCLQGSILEPFSIFGGSQNRPLKRHFHEKCSPKVRSFPGRSVLGATCGPKWSQDAPRPEFHRFWIDFQRILVDFVRNLEMIHMCLNRHPTNPETNKHFHFVLPQPRKTCHL